MNDLRGSQGAPRLGADKPIAFVLLALMYLPVCGEGNTSAQNIHPESERRDIPASETKEASLWIVPSQVKDAEPIWGIKGGIAVGLWPTPGPRGLIRIYTPYLGQGRLRMINFIAVEPIVGTRRGLSELEPSALDKTPGKAMWTANELNLSKSTSTNVPASGKVIALGGIQALTFFIYVESFTNGARPIVQVTLRQDRPHEVAFKIFAARGSAVMRSCILTATMDNYARLRQLWLKDQVIKPSSLWSEFKADTWGFAPAHTWNSDRLLKSAGSAIVAAAPDETDPAHALYAADVPASWRYQGAKGTQYWQAPFQRDLLVRVNGRKTYWASKAQIPGGVSFENLELQAPFHAGQEFRFGVIPGTPEKLGFPKIALAPGN